MRLFNYIVNVQGGGDLSMTEKGMVQVNDDSMTEKEIKKSIKKTLYANREDFISVKKIKEVPCISRV